MKRSGAERRRHVVAWINKAEWDQVLDYLYSQDAALQRFALQRVSAWRGRYAHSTPVAVDCTAELVRCQVLDRCGQLSGDDLVLLYGAALMRFVNLITEKQQGRKARPLRRLAGKLNIPEWVVDLRHDFTHRKLPTLMWCRKGCRVVLEWLQQEYWSRQLGGGGAADDDWESQSDGEDDDAEPQRPEGELTERQREVEAYKAARDLLVSYEKERYQSLDAAQDDKWPGPFADMSWLLGEIKQFSVDAAELLADVLLEDGFLVPTAEQLETLGCGAPAEPGASEPRVPAVFLRFWLPLLKMLSAPAFVQLLLGKLLAELKPAAAEQRDRRCFYICAWASEFLRCNGERHEFRFESKTQKKARARERIFAHRVQLRWRQLLSACLDAPCAHTPRLLQLILADMEPPLPQETRHRLLRLCAIYTQAPDPQRGPSEELRRQPVYTVESLQRGRPRRSADSRTEASADVGGADALAEKAAVLRGSPWQVCPDKVAWKNFPLGKVPGQSDDPSCLMAETHSTMAVTEQPVELEGGGGGRRQSAAGVSGPARTAEGLLWGQSDFTRLKSGLKLF